MRPLLLPPNGVPRFYRGGAAIAELRGIEPVGERVPEDWVGSMTTVFGEKELGLSRLADGRLLRDAARENPVAFFGPGHAARRGADPALLVKLLDAGERLPVHVHPNGSFARAALGSPYGKTEAWLVIDAPGRGATVGVGFREDVPAETLARWVQGQDRQALLDSLNPIEVGPGDAIFVPAGVPHAIGEGVLIVELQEPSDLSILLEWRGFANGAGDGEATLGLGWEVALRCVELSHRDPDRLSASRGDGSGAVTSLLPAEADNFFRAERIEAAPAADLEQGFAILVVTEGSGALHPASGEPLEIGRGDTVLVPWDAGACRLEGELVGLACRPPAPELGGAP
ncbi:MAG: class I mannose-6-phosphate isomerase [Thermoleophilaceae bacterium]